MNSEIDPQEIDLQEIGRHYLVAALWTEQEEIGDKEAADMSEEAEKHIAEAVAKFVEAAGPLLPAYIDRVTPSPGYSAEAQAGHDLWLTRNHHGAGFWDRGLDELGDSLTQVAHAMGEVSLIVGDDGKLYFYSW